MACSLFISYRRKTNEETNYKGFVAHINDVLKYRYNIHEDDLFFDKRSMGVGDEFKQEIEKNAIACKALILIINRDWEAQFREKKEKNEDDFVLTEILCALKSSHKVIFFPVLVNRKEVPKSEDLPEELKTHIDLFKEFNVCDFSGDFTKVDSFVSTELGKKIVEKLPELCNPKVNLRILEAHELKPEDLLGERSKVENKYNEKLYYARDSVDTKLITHFQETSSPQVLIHGKSMAGKTRCVYQFLKYQLKQLDHYEKHKICIFKENSIDEFIKAFQTNSLLRDTIVVIDELYKCYLRIKDKSGFRNAFSKVCTNQIPLLTTCTSEELKHFEIQARNNEDAYSNDLWYNIKGLKHISIKAIKSGEKEDKELADYYGLKSKGDTIGERIGVSHPWEVFDAEKQDDLTLEVLEAVERMGYIKRGQFKVYDILSYLNNKIQNKNINFRPSKFVNLTNPESITFNARDLTISFQILCDVGIIYSPEYCSEDTRILIDEEYTERKIKTIPFQKIIDDICDFNFSNKNIARLIGNKNANRKIIESLYKKRAEDQEDLVWVQNAYARTTTSNYSEIKSFYENLNFKHNIVSLRTIALKCDKESIECNTRSIEGLKFVLIKSENVKEEYLNEEEEWKPRKIDILNNLLKTFTEEEIASNHPHSDKDNIIDLRDYFDFDYSTHKTIIEHKESEDEIREYYQSNDLSNNFHITRHIINNFRWSLDDYEYFINMFYEYPHDEDRTSDAIHLFNLALKKVPPNQISKFYEWGSLNIGFDRISQNTYLTHIEYPDFDLLEELKSEEDLDSMILLNTCIRKSKNFKDALIFYNKIRCPDDRSFNFLAEKISSVKQYDEVKKLMSNHLYVQHAYSLSTLIKKRVQANTTSTDIYDELFNPEKSNFLLNSVLAGMLLHNARSYQEVLFLLSEYEKQKVVLESDFYSNLLGVQVKFKDEIESNLTSSEIKKHTTKCFNKLKTFKADNHLYKAVLGNDFYKQHHSRYFKAYEKELIDNQVFFDFVIVKNFVKSERGFTQILKKLEDFPEIQNKLNSSFLNMKEIISSEDDIENVTKYCQERNWGYPQELLCNIILFKIKKKQKEFNLLDELKNLSEQGLFRHAGQFNHIIKNKKVIRNHKFEILQSIFLDENYNSMIKPDPATYSEWITSSPDYVKAKFAFDEMQKSGLKPNHILYNNLLRKAPTWEDFKSIFEQLEQKILTNEEVDIDRKDLSYTFNALKSVINSDKCDELEKRQAIALIEEKKEQYNYQIDSAMVAQIIKDWDLAKSIEYLKTYASANIKNYNSLFVKCKTFSDVELLVSTIRTHMVVTANNETYYQLAEKIAGYKDDTVSGFNYIKHQFTFLDNWEIGIFKRDYKSWSQLLYLWLQQANNIQEAKQVFVFDPEWRIPKNKNFLPWELDWFENTINSISSAEDARLFYSRIENSWKVDFVKQLIKPNKINEYISEEPNKETLARSWQWSCEDINEFRLIRSIFPDIVSSNCQGNPWYKRVIQSIHNLNDANYFYEALDDDWKMDNQVVDILIQLGSIEDKKRFIKNKPDRNNLKESILHFSCNNLSDFKDIQKIIPDLVANKNTLWYKRVVSSINNLNDANYFYDSLDDNWKKDLQVVHLMKQLDSIEEKKKFVANKPDRNNLSLSCLYHCSDINEFRALIEIFPGSYFPNFNAPWYGCILNSIANIEDARYFTKGLNAIDNIQVIQDAKAQLNTNDQHKLTKFCAKTKRDRSKQLELVRSFNEFKSVTVKYPNWKVPSYHRADWYKYTIQTINNLNDAKYFFDHLDKKANHNHVTNIVCQLQTQKEKENFFKYILKDYPRIKYNENRMRKILGD